MKHLYYSRPSQHKFYSEIFKKSDVISSFDTVYLTEVYSQFLKLDGDKNLTSYFLDIKKKSNAEAPSFFSDAEIETIIRRDRYLRSIKTKKALRYVNTVTVQLIELYEKIKPNLVSSHLVDGFTIDIFHRIAQKKNITSFTPVWNGFGNTCKFYNRNVIIQRDSPLEEVSLKKEMSKKRIDITNPDISEKSFSKRLRTYINSKKSLLKHCLKSGYFYGKSSIHLQFRLSQTMALPKLNFRDLSNSYFDNLSDITLSFDKPIVYVSCHLNPEATLDYFTSDLSLINHDEIILSIIQKYHQSVQFIVKEHPVMYNNRTLEFYDEIKRYPNTYLLDPSIPYFTVLEKVDAVISWGGSVGFEAPFFGVRPLSIGKPFYHVIKYDNFFVNRNDIEENFERKLNALDFSVLDYQKDLDKKFKYLLFKGIMHQKHGRSERNKILMGQSIDYLLNNILLEGSEGNSIGKV